MEQFNFKPNIMDIVQIQLDLFCAMLSNKSSNSIFTSINKSLNPKDMLSISETMLQLSKENIHIPENLIDQLLDMISNYLSEISIKEQIDSIQFYISKMESFVFFLKAQQLSKEDNTAIEMISNLLDKMKQPLEDQEFSCDSTFLGEFTTDFYDLIHHTIRFYKLSESLSRQFITYSNNLEKVLGELFLISSVLNQLENIHSILESYREEMKTKSISMNQTQCSIFRKKPPNNHFIYKA